MKKIIEENLSKDYYRLMDIGNAMLAYYDGRVLNSDQIELIANSSNDDKISGMNLAAAERLLLKYSYPTFQKNTDAIKTAKLIRRK